MNGAFLSREILGNTVGQYLYALGAFLAILFGLWVFKEIVVVRLGKLARKTKTKLDDLAVKILSNAGWPLFYILLSFYLALKLIHSPQILDRVLYYSLIVIVSYLAVRATEHIIDFAEEKVIEKQEQTEERKIDKAVIDLLSKSVKIIVWSLAIVLVLDNFGYNVSTLIAGLGIGGIAVAFALQNILSDIFASFSIYFDRPFQVGDFIVIGQDKGTVKHIGIKSTRLQTLEGQELIIANKELTSVRVNNYKKMKRRRVDFTIGVTYETSTEKLRKIPAIIEKIFESIELADLDRAHFKEFADFSLNFEIVYYINSKKYLDYMDTQQEINFKIKEAFEKEKIEMAYPTQTVFVKK